MGLGLGSEPRGSLPRRLKEPRLSPGWQPSCATVSAGVTPGAPHASRPSPWPDRNPSVDRETARKNMGSGLFAAAFAAAVFALCFIAAFLYIAQ